MAAPSSSRSRARGIQTEVVPDPVTEKDLMWKRLVNNKITLQTFKSKFSQSGFVLKFLKDRALKRNPGVADTAWEVVDGRS